MSEHINFDDIDIDETNRSLLTDKNFVKFLKDNKLYEKFMSNLIYPADIFCNTIQRPSYISSAFPWSSTPDGQDFWLKWAVLWSKEIMKNLT